MKAYIVGKEQKQEDTSNVDPIPAHWIFEFQQIGAEQLDKTFKIILFEGKDDDKIKELLKYDKDDYDISISLAP